MPKEANQQIEHRALGKIELRAADDGKKFIEGYAIKWGEKSLPLGYFYKFTESFRAGAFDDYLKSGEDTKFLIDHESGKVLGRSKKGTLTLRSDSTGLWYSLEVPATSIGNDAYEDVKVGNKENISVGFRMVAEEWDESNEDDVKRTVIKANLPEISLTAWPYYESSSASTRSAEPYQLYKESRKEEKPPEVDWKTDNLRMKLNHYEKHHKLSN